jgi:hypothetical protein
MQFSRKTGWLVPALFLAAVVAAPARSAEPDKFVPADSEAVAVVNFEQILNSAIVKQYGVEQLRTQINNNKDAKKFFETSGIDPFKDIHSVTLAASSLTKGADAKYVVIVHGRFDPEKMHAAIAEQAKADGTDIKVETKDGLKIYELKEKKSKDKPMYAAFANKGTLIVSPSSDSTAAAAKGTGGTLSPELLNAMKDIGKESFYAAVVITDDMKKEIAKNPNPQTAVFAKLQYLTAYVDLTSDLKIKLTIQTADDQAATNVKKMISQILPVAAMMAAGQQEKLGPTITELVKKIEVKKEPKNAVAITLNVTEEMMKEMHKAATEAAKKDSEKDKQ